MIRYKLGDLLEKHQFDHGRHISIKEVAASTGINRATLSKILNQKGYSTGTNNLDKLCTFFGCGLADIAEHLREK